MEIITILLVITLLLAIAIFYLSFNDQFKPAPPNPNQKNGPSPSQLKKIEADLLCNDRALCSEFYRSRQGSQDSLEIAAIKFLLQEETLKRVLTLLLEKYSATVACDHMQSLCSMIINSLNDRINGVEKSMNELKKSKEKAQKSLETEKDPTIRDLYDSIVSEVSASEEKMTILAEKLTSTRSFAEALTQHVTARLHMAKAAEGIVEVEEICALFIKFREVLKKVSDELDFKDDLELSKIELKATI